MQNLDEEKQQKFNVMFFSLKVIALCFCMAPIIQHFFSESAKTAVLNLNIGILMLVIVSVITFMWLLISRSPRKVKSGNYAEMAIFFGIILCAVVYSGLHLSYYKYLFIFMICVYTIEFGMTTGLVLSGISSLTVLAIDLICYRGTGVNPYFEADIALSAMFFVVAVSLGFYVKVENQHIRNLINLANIDGLTGAFNHRCFYETMTEDFHADPAGKEPLSVLMLDIDYFKNYNDLLGHLQGDKVLKEFCGILFRIADGNKVFRYGGEEFTIILKGTEEPAAMELAEKIRSAVNEYRFEGVEMLPNKCITVSIGVTGRRGETDTPAELLGRADSALYRAKFFRKNRVELYSSVFDRFSGLDTAATGERIASIKSLITIINSRDHYTFNHTERVVQYCETFADYLGLSPEDKKNLVYGAYLHDIGKINVPKDILLSPKRLTEEEWNEIRQHPQDSADIIRPLGSLPEVVPIVLEHHEHYDGSGYPSGLKGTEIDRFARMLALADSFDAMTARRPYQNTKTYEEAFAEIRRCAGTQFDPELSEKFIEAIRHEVL